MQTICTPNLNNANNTNNTNNSNTANNKNYSNHSNNSPFKQLTLQTTNQKTTTTHNCHFLANTPAAKVQSRKRINITMLNDWHKRPSTSINQSTKIHHGCVHRFHSLVTWWWDWFVFSNMLHVLTISKRATYDFKRATNDTGGCVVEVLTRPCLWEIMR